MSLPNAITREDYYLNKIANPSDDHELPDAITRQQHYLKAIAENAGGGGSAIHYSTDEQAVGTWIDGSTIYEKTWIFDSSVNCESNSWSDTPISASEIISIIDGKAYDISNDGNLVAFWGNVGISCDNTYIQIMNTRNIAIGVKCMVLQYLKSST